MITQLFGCKVIRDSIAPSKGKDSKAFSCPSKYWEVVNFINNILL